MYHVYILASKMNGTLYIGVTGELANRVLQHKERKYSGFTSKYKVNRLVYFEEFEDVDRAIEREKQLKKWKRSWKLNLINQFNPTWRDLYYEI